MEDKKETKNDDNEEINIDFSKVKNVFSKFKNALNEDDEPKKESSSQAEVKESPQKDEPSQTPSTPTPVVSKEESQKSIEKPTETVKKEVPKGYDVKPKYQESPSQDKKEDEEEIAINTDVIKNFFGKVKKSFSEKDSSDAEDTDFAVNIQKSKKFVQKNHAVLIVALLLIICMGTSIYLRSIPAELPATHGWAENAVHQQLRGQIAGQVAGQYPNLPDANRNEIIDAEVAEFWSQNQGQIQAQSSQLAQVYKAHLQNEHGNTYLLAIDPYFWLRKARNIIDNGHVGDELRDGIPYDNHMIAPMGREMPPDMFHAHVIAWAYKIVDIFGNPDLMGVSFFIPVLLSALACIPAFFIARRIGGNLAGFIASFLIAVHPAFLTRTAGGFSDTDAYNVLFPLFITWFFLEAFETENTKKKIILSSLAGLLVGFYSISWGGWWYILDFLLATSGLYLVYYIAIHFKELKSVKAIFNHKPIVDTVMLIGIFIISSAIFVSMFFTFSDFVIAPLQPLNFATIKDVATTTVWPNVFTTVAEQNEANYDQIINQIGGRFLFYLAIIGVILAAFKKDRHGKRDVKMAILLALWFIATIYASTKGIRWTLLLVPAFAIALGVFSGIIFDYLMRWSKKELSINKWISGTVIVVLLLFLVGLTPIPPFCSTGLCKSAYNTANQEIPSMNDAWYESLTRIKEDSQPNAIITSWWDFGHWFKYIADRPVTFDGTSQGTPMAHWVGKSLLTSSEEESIGILRMLDCGSNMAFDELDKIIQKPHRSIDILNQIIVEDKESAKEVLQEYELTSTQADNILQWSHCNPPEAYFITSSDMIGKSGVWGHFGAWDFDRATQFNKIRQMSQQEALTFLEEEFNMTGSEAQSRISEIRALGVGRDANDWIAPWPSYASDINGCGRIDENTVSCPFSNGAFAINVENMSATIDTQEGQKNLVSLLVEKNGTLEFQEYDNNVGFGMVLIQEGDSYSRVLAAPEQVNSIFSRLYFLDGVDSKYFEKFSDERSLFGQHIKVWKVDWEGKVQERLQAALAEEARLQEEAQLAALEEAQEELEESSLAEESSEEDEALEENAQEESEIASETTQEESEVDQNKEE